MRTNQFKFSVVNSCWCDWEQASKETERDLLDEHFDLVDEDQDDDVSDEEEERDGGKRVKMFAAKNVEAATAFRENKSLQVGW